MTTTTSPQPTVPEIGDPARDYLNLDSLFSAEELALRDRVREFVQRRIVPNIAQWYEKAVFPVEITTEMGDLGLLGMHLRGYGCAGRSAVEYGLAAMELVAGRSRSLIGWERARTAGISLQVTGFIQLQREYRCSF